MSNRFKVKNASKDKKRFSRTAEKYNPQNFTTTFESMRGGKRF